jgi:glycosyltransferase involved in cell wall biosynthesis
MKPTISILMPVYNGEKFLSEAIQSVIDQTYKHWELIIINDGSTDDTEKILEGAKQNDSRIISLNKSHSGVVKSLNYGLNNASGKFIARIDSDDLWFPGKLKFQIFEFEKNKNLMLHGTSVVFIDEAGKKLHDQRGFNNKKHLNYRQIRYRLMKNNLFCHSSVMFRRELLELIGAYNERFKNSEDYEFWIRAARHAECEISDRVMAQYRVWSETVSLQKREEQIIFSLKARASGMFTLGNPLFNLIYLTRFLLISIVYIFRNKLKNFKQGIRT